MLETAQAGSPTDDFANNHVLANRLFPTGTIGNYYDRIACRVVTQAGNVNMGLYDDTGSTAPNVLLSSTGGIAVPAAGYVGQAMTEVALTTAQAWAALNHDSTSARFKRHAETSGYLKFKQPVSYPTLESPLSGTTDNASPFDMKIEHS